MKVQGSWLLAASLLTMAAPAFSEELAGVVKVTGSGITAQTMVSPVGEEKGPEVCGNDVGKKIRRLGAMTLKVTGDWKVKKNGDKGCFNATEFKVLKTSSGRDAVVGTLAQKNGSFVVTGSDGHTHVLDDVTGGLKKLEGQKVILDIKPINSPTAKEPVYKVVTYAAHP